jgi:hypothetical protein
LLDGLTRSPVVRPNQLEPVEDVLGAGCRPHGEEMVIRIGEGSTAADGHETRVAVFREDHSSQHSLLLTSTLVVSSASLRPSSQRLLQKCLKLFLLWLS